MEISNENFRAMIFYDFKYGLTKQQCVDRLRICFGYVAPYQSTIHRWFVEFKRGRASLNDEFRGGRPATVVVAKIINAERDMIMSDRNVPYREMEASLDIDRTAIRTIFHEHLEVKKIMQSLHLT